MVECKICQKECKSNKALSQHLRRQHKNITLKQYYDKFLRKENEGICPICKKETHFAQWHYLLHCSKKCMFIDPTRMEKVKQTNRRLHNVDHHTQLKSVQDKKKQTCKDKYDGIDNVSKLKKIKDAKIQSYQNNYGKDHWTQSERGKHILKELCKNRTLEELEEINKKLKITWSKHTEEHNQQIKENHIRTSRIRWNTDWPIQNPIIKQRVKNTVLNFTDEQWEKIYKQRSKTYNEKTGYDNPSQNPIVRIKMIKNSFRKKEYVLPSGKIILLQGEEPYFLDYVFKNNLLKEEEINFHSIKIKFFTSDNKQHYYFPDFYIPKHNLVVEIKSWYILSIQPYNDLKIAATKATGFNFIMILDKKYDSFKNLITQLERK